MIHMDTKQLACVVCGHSWTVRNSPPKRCPKCRSLRWESGEDGRAEMKLIPVRVPLDQQAQFARAAKTVGKSTSEWLRDLGAQAMTAVVRTFSFSQKLDPEKWEPNMGLVVEPEEWARFEAAAQHSGMKMEAWILEACRIANGKYEIEYASVKGFGYMRMVDVDRPKTGRGLFNPEHPYHPTGADIARRAIRAVEMLGQPDTVIGAGESDTRSARAIELADSIPGLRVGMPDLQLGADTPEEPESLAFVTDLAQRYADDPGDAMERLDSRTGGEWPPKDCARWMSDKVHLRRLAEWIDKNHGGGW